MVLKGLPREYKVPSFQEFKVSLRNFEENEKVLCDGESNQVIRAEDS